MTLHTSSGSIWPARLAYAAALIFTAASGTTNLLYGWNRGMDVGSSLVWATVSLGVSIVFSLSWPAFIRATDDRQSIRAFIILVGLLLTGTYSVSAALGSAYGGRVQASNAETEKTDARSKANTAYKAAKAELDTLVPARSRAELDPQIRSLKATRGANNCETRDGPISRKVCAETDDLEAEAARVDRRAKLAETMKEASKVLEAIGPGTVANSDAVALTSYLASIGVKADPDVVNKLLVLLAVLVIECGGGVSLTIGMSLQTAQVTEPNNGSFSVPERVQGERSISLNDRHGHPLNDPTMATDLSARSNYGKRAQNAGTLSPNQPLNDATNSPASVRLHNYLRERGGVLVCPQRTLADALGWSKTRLHQVLHELASSGVVKLQTGRTGTVVQLVPA